MLQKLPVSNFEQIKDTPQFNEDFLNNYDEEIDEGHFLKVDVPYLEKLYKLYNDLLFLPERIKTEKVDKLVTGHDKTEYVIHIRNFKQALSHGIFF